MCQSFYNVLYIPVAEEVLQKSYGAPLRQVGLHLPHLATTHGKCFCIVYTHVFPEYFCNISDNFSYETHTIICIGTQLKDIYSQTIVGPVLV